MQLVADWRWVVRYAWSIRFMLAAGLLEGLNVTLQLIGAMVLLPPFVSLALPIAAGICASLSLIARIVAQTRRRPPQPEG